MRPRVLPLVVTLLLVSALLAGCSSTPATPPIATPAPSLAPTTEAPVTTTTVIQTTAPPEPFPGALSIGTPYRYGREDIAMEVAVYKVKAVTEYDWWSPNWGKYWNTTARKGNHFIFVLVRLIDRGTARARLPSPSLFVLHGDDGSAYIQTSDRDHSLWVKGIDVKQYDFYYDDRAGWIDPGESNRVDGFFLYEVPESLTPDHAYLGVIFSSKADAVWKLG